MTDQVEMLQHAAWQQCNELICTPISTKAATKRVCCNFPWMPPAFSIQAPVWPPI